MKKKMQFGWLIFYVTYESKYAKKKIIVPIVFHTTAIFGDIWWQKAASIYNFKIRNLIVVAIAIAVVQ